MELLGIIRIINVGFDIPNQLLVRFSAFVTYWERNWSTMIQYISAKTFIDFRKNAGLEVNTQKLSNVDVISPQSLGPNHDIMIAKAFFEMWDSEVCGNDSNESKFDVDGN
jgi:hypothetical protein